MDWLTDSPIAHRGLHTERVPENTLGAFEAAVERGYPVELDVRLTADGVPVVFHDATLGRLTGRDVAVSRTTVSSLEDVTLLDSDARIPRFSEALSTIDGDVPLLVEIKSRGRPGALETTVAGMLDTYDGPFAVQSFNPLSVGWFRRNRPEWPRGQLAGVLGDVALNPLERAVSKRLLANWYSQPDFVGYEHDRLPFQPVNRRRENGVPVLAWTVRTRDALHRVDPYVDNVIFEGIRP